MEDNIVHFFAPISKEYLLSRSMNGAPMPANATEIVPHDAVPNVCEVWDANGAVWVSVPNYRGVIYDVKTGAARVMETLGDMPDGFTNIVPPDLSTAPGASVYDFTNGSWVLNGSRAASVASAVAKKQRNVLLSATDYVVMPDTDASDDCLVNFKAYRQALRDLPGTKGWPTNITWPTQPDYTKTQS